MSFKKLQDCEFLLSAVKTVHYPDHHYPEIALVGRSNVGKSSLINVVVNRKGFARVSGTPGRTQTINFYRVDQIGIVDLPGYGFAKVPLAVREKWQPMIEDYLTKRKNLVGVLQLIDIRHDPSKEDKIMAEWLHAIGLPAWVVATKADKIGKSKYKPNLEKIVNELKLPGVIFSAHTKFGKESVIDIINQLVLKK